MLTTNPKLWYLKNYDLFEGISEADITKVAADTQMIEPPAHTVLYEASDEVERVYVIKKGEVRLFHQHPESGKKVIFDTLEPGDVFGGISPESSQYGHFAQTMPGTCVCAFSQAEFLALISTYPQVMFRFMKHMTSRVAEYQQEFGKYQSKADDLVLHELQRLNDKRQRGWLGTIINRPLRATHEEIATLTGLNRVTVTRAMKSLREQSLIEYDSHTGVITLQ